MDQIKFATVVFAGVLAMMTMVIANADEKKETIKPAEAKAEKKAAAATPSAHAEKNGALPKDVKKLIVQDTVTGAGKVATKGKKIKVNYTGWLYDPTQPMGRGKQFDTSVGREPFTFKLGGGEVIKGWDEGFENMKVGGKRMLIIPADMGYGSRGAGDVIPPNRALTFEVELLDVL